MDLHLNLDKPLVYVGIGSRVIPKLQVRRIERLAQVLAEHRWVLRTGLAKGADQLHILVTHFPNSTDKPFCPSGIGLK